MTKNFFCSLCSNESIKRPIYDDTHVFCCVGCQTVFKVLSAANKLDNFENSQVFKQAAASGLISNPALLEQIREKKIIVKDDERDRAHFEIGDMWCPSCAEVIRLMLMQQKGVLNCVIDYTTDLASIEFSPRYISKDSIQKTINQLGYEASSLEAAGKNQISRFLYLRLIIAAFFSLNVMMLSYPVYASFFSLDDEGMSRIFVWLSFVSSIPVLVFSGWPIFRRFITALSIGVVGMEALIVLGVFSSFSLSLYEMINNSKHIYFDSMCVIITFVLLGKLIESKAKFSAKDSLFRLVKSLPKRARKVFPGGKKEFVPLKDIKAGDHLAVHTGEKIVLDGEIVSGECSCDESLMTGESMPVHKYKTDFVLSGTVVINGTAVYRVVNPQKETALEKIISIVEQDIGHKSVYTRAVDPIVSRFIPVVIAIALGTVFGCLFHGCDYRTAFMRGISVLLISCPCAIGIAAPMAESQILNVLSCAGAIVRNRGCLPDIGRETVFVFDKTGTITQGCFSVCSGLEGLCVHEIKVLKALTSHTNHPVSKAISQQLATDPLSLQNIREVSGAGMIGFDHDVEYRLGNCEWTGCQPIDTDLTQVFFTRGGKLITVLTLGDQLRDEAKEVVSSLHSVKTLLLSGDRQNVVVKVAKACGFDEWKSRCSPFEKREIIEKLRKNGEIVAMIGDGINDAPALTASNIGISVVSASDLSVQVSDILFTTDRLDILSKLRTVAIKGQKIIKQNLFWAFFYNIIGIFLAASGYLSPIFSAGAMVSSSIIVLMNTRRIR